MITPLFECQQDEKTVTVNVRAPHSRVRDIDISVIDCDLHFHCRPYLLHLRFPHALKLDPETNPASYDIDTGIARIPLVKSEPGQYFERLDMLSTLLVKRQRGTLRNGQVVQPSPNIEVLSSEASDARLLPAVRSDSVSVEATSRAFNEDVIDVAGVHVSKHELGVGVPHYGFAGRYAGYFGPRAEDTSELVELDDPDGTPVWRRAALREESEDAKFDPEHFAADLMLAYEFQHVFDYRPVYEIAVSNDAKDALLKLPKREYLPDIDTAATADLAGILFASCYDMRVTCGERCVESPWTISRVCASFAFLQPMHNVRDAVLAAYRRSLAYPLYRHRRLSALVLADTKRLVQCSTVDALRSRLLRVLIELRLLFESDKLFRVFSDLFLTDYCIWIQSVDGNVLEIFASDMRELEIEKSSIGWDLNALESAAMLSTEGEVPEEPVAEPSQEQISQQPGIVATMGRQSGMELTAVRTRVFANSTDSSSDEASSTDSSDSDTSSD